MCHRIKTTDNRPDITLVLQEIALCLRIAPNPFAVFFDTLIVNSSVLGFIGLVVRSPFNDKLNDFIADSVQRKTFSALEAQLVINGI